MTMLASVLVILMVLTLAVGRNGDTDTNPRFIATRSTVPSSPTDVELVAVSKSSLGILWAASVSNGMSCTPLIYVLLATHNELCTYIRWF
jgi:hypothetical protein